MQQVAYPVHFSVDYPDRELDRLSSAFRIIVAIPILILIGSIAGDTFEWGGKARTIAAGGTGILFIPVLLMIVFRQKYPRWWYDWNLQFARFSARVGAYLALMDDQYPSTDEEQSVHLDMPYPDVPNDLNRWLPLVKWLLAIPPYHLLFFLAIASPLAIIIGW